MDKMDNSRNNNSRTSSSSKNSKHQSWIGRGGSSTTTSWDPSSNISGTQTNGEDARRHSWAVEETSYIKCSPPVKEYMEATSLHGVKYIAEDGRHWTERLLWTFLVLLGFIITFIFIWPIWRKYLDSPTLTTIGSTNYPIWEINFPGVTICPSNKVVEEKLNIIKKQSPWVEDIEEFGQINFDKLLHLMTGFRNIQPDIWDDFDELEGVINRLGQGNLTTLMQKVMPSCSEFLIKCWWRGEAKKCSDLFEVRKTDEGFCCSFNTLEQSQNLDISLVVPHHASSAPGFAGVLDWFENMFDEGDYVDIDEEITTTTEEPTTTTTSTTTSTPASRSKLYFPEADNETTDGVNSPGELQFVFNSIADESLKKGLAILTRGTRQAGDIRTSLFTQKKRKRRTEYDLLRSNSASYLLGLNVLMDAKSGDYFVAPENYVGFKVMVHNPITFPEVSSKGTVIDSGKEAFLAVSSIHTESSEFVRAMDVKRRNCIFADERDVPNAEVTVFKTYSQENCFLECRAKTLLKTCGCLPYFYPRLDAILQFQEGFKNLTAACTLEGWKCLMASTHVLEAIDPMSHNSKIDHVLDLETKQTLQGAKCFCPPSCTNTQYSATHSLATFPNKASRVMKELKTEFKDFDREEDLSLLHVYFKDLAMIKYNKDVIYSIEDLIAAFGGLIGLCTGFSLLSLAEVIYFFTLRWWLQLCQEKREFKLKNVPEESGPFKIQIVKD